MDQSLNLQNLSKRLFREEKGKIFIGDEEITPELLDILREQARYLETSQFYEILLATLKNESATLSLIQSKDWDDINFAKALWHITFVLENMVFKLKRK